MIIRSVASRHGFRALASPAAIRAMSTTATAAPTTATAAPQTQPYQQLTPATVSKTDGKDYLRAQRIKRTTGTLGSDYQPGYEPYKQYTQPLGPRDVTLELLLASQTHMGHSTALWNPANQRYIYGVRAGIHIISLETTAAYLRRAARVVEGVAMHGGTALFLGTRKGQQRSVVKAAKLAGGCHLFDRWIPGTITNGDKILAENRVKMVGTHDEEIVTETTEKMLGRHRALMPDLVVCLNPLENYIALRECGSAGIPTIGIIDTDADPTWVTYPIPANDDSLRSTNLIAGVLGRAGESGQASRKQMAEQGITTWDTSMLVREWTKEDPVLMERLKGGLIAELEQENPPVDLKRLGEEQIE